MIAVVDSGYGNLRSVAKALTAAGGEVVVTSDPAVVDEADRVVVPGQGAFGDCMAGLRARGLDAAVRRAIDHGRPYLGICLGLQILFEASEESPGVEGLGLFSGQVARLRPTGLKVPHMGWNDVHLRRDEPLWRGIADGAHVYFVHSYAAVPTDRAVIALAADYGGEVVAAVRRDHVFACQFHPEKSQAVGLALLRNFVSA